MPADIRDRIYRYLLPAGPVIVGDYPSEALPANAKKPFSARFIRTPRPGATHYVTTYGDERREVTTYFVRPLHMDLHDVHLSIMIVSKQIHDETSRFILRVAVKARSPFCMTTPIKWTGSRV